MSNDDLLIQINAARQCVADNRLPDALIEVESVSVWQNDVLQLQNQLASLKEDERQRLLTPEDSRARHAQVTKQILETLSKFEDGIATLEPGNVAEHAKLTNPFHFGGSVPPDQFIGRRDTLRAIGARVGGAEPQSISLVGLGRMGKSSILRYVHANYNEFLSQNYSYIVIYIDLMRATSHSVRGLMRLLRTEITNHWQEPWPQSDDGKLEEFDYALEALNDAGFKLVLCLDDIENLTKRKDEFDDMLEDWRSNGSHGRMAMITASKISLADLCAAGGLTSPFYNIFSTHQIGLLNTEDLSAVFSKYSSLSGDEKSFLSDVPGRHPFFLQMAASILWEAKGNAFTPSELKAKLATQMEPHLRKIWQGLSLDEQTLLKRRTLNNAQTNSSALEIRLQERGLLDDCTPFSVIFADFIQTV